MITSIKLLKITGRAIFAALVMINFSACEKDEGGGGVTPTTEGNYIIFDGYKLEFINPTKGDLRESSGDTSLVWKGNQPSGVLGDTILTIRHAEKRVAGSNTINPFAIDKGEVALFIEWGTVDGKPDVVIDGGSYLFTLVNGVWQSTLTNGTGFWIKNSGDTARYSGIEFKATWPN